MNMRERGLIGSRPLLFVVKVKRPRFEVHRQAFSDLGGGKAVLVRYGAARHGPVWNGEAVMARLGEVRLGMAVEVGSVRVRHRKARCGKAVRVRFVSVGCGVARRSRLG
jgi:hypothetical protein